MKKIAKQSLALVLSIIMIVSMLTVGVSAATTDTGFSDTVDSAYSHIIDELAEAGIVAGIGGGKFGPDLPVSRAMAITILGRMAGIKGAYTGGFSDVTVDDYYAGYVGWAVDNGIVIGDGEGHFMPNKGITGYEMDLMLARYAELVGIDYTAANQSNAILTRAELAAMVYVVYTKTPGTNASYTSEVVWFEDDWGSAIYGEMYYPANFDASKTYPVVIASHGFGVTSFFFSLSGWAQQLASEGYVVYAFDFHGGAPDEGGIAGVSRSTGSWMNMSIMTEVNDLNNVIDFIKTKDFVNPNQIFLIGQSQGGIVTALTAAQREVNGQNDIAGAILLYPYLNVADDVRAKYSSKEELPTANGTDEWLDTPMGVRYFQDIYDLDVYEAISGYNGNVLIIQGLADTTVPYEAVLKALTESYAEQPAELALVAGTNSGHTFEAFGYPEGKEMAFAAVTSSLANWTASTANLPIPDDRPVDPTLETVVAQHIPYIDDSNYYHILDIYDAVGSNVQQPLVIEIHGGGLIGQSKKTNYLHSDYYAQHGFKVVTPNYTLMPDGDYKTIVQDLFAMFAWVEQHADQYNYNTDQVFLSGDSAGGYITALLAAVLNTPSLQEYYGVTPPAGLTIRGYILTCPMADQEDLVKALDGEAENFLNSFIFAPTIGADILKNEDLMSHAILFNIIDPETYPEVYIITTPDGGDPYYRDAKMLHEFLDENNIPNIYKEYSSIENSLGHCFNSGNDSINYVESRLANDAAIEYMLGLCAK